jgi:hypothetical protein
VHALTYSSDRPNILAIDSQIRADGSPNLQPVNAAPKHLDFTGSAGSEHTALIDELHSILKSIPTESPPGSEDIYGLDTSIVWGSDDLVWQNGGPQGCVGGTSDVQPTEEDRVKFKRAVEIVKKLADS